ncbi:hypothetical protein WDU94_007392 [Cyamophila willieti]
MSKPKTKMSSSNLKEHQSWPNLKRLPFQNIPKPHSDLFLPHSPLSKVSDVLLIITDERKHHRKLRHDDEMYIVNFEQKLKDLGVKEVNKVMSLRQIRAEYYTHEMRRKLSDMYDVFLVDGKIACKLSSLIGKFFYSKNKTPIPVSLEKEDKIKLEVERALRKTQLVFKSTCCTTSVVRIGHTDMSPKELSENLEAFSKALDTSKYPGGWRNIKKVHVKTPTSIAFPVYYSFVTPNEIENAELKQTLPKHCVAVKGELSTIGRDVTVKPDGSIEVEGVDDIKSLMHQLYKHAGFKDHKDLDLTNAEYKELVKELRKNIPIKKQPEDPNEPTEADVEDLIDNDDDEDDSASDDNSIQGDIQREDDVHGDFEENDKDDEEEEEKGDSVEASYMKQWEETWMNKDDDEEEEKGGKKKKGKKNAKTAAASSKNVKNPPTTKNRKQQAQNAAAAAKGGPANKRKLDQIETSEQSSGGAAAGGKKMKAKESAVQTQKKENVKTVESIKNVDKAKSGKGKTNKEEPGEKGKKKQGNVNKGQKNEKNQKQNQGGSKKENVEKVGQKAGQKIEKENQGGKKVKTSEKQEQGGKKVKTSEKQEQGGKKVKTSEKQEQGGKKVKTSEKQDQGSKKVKTSKKDTPLRQKGGVVNESTNEVVIKKKKGKKAGAPAPNFIPL